MRKLNCFLLALVLALSAVTAAHAAEGTVTYDGKAQEYRDRRVYNAAASMARHANDAPKNAAAASCASCADTAEAGDSLILFATTTCPNCKMAKRFLDEAGLAYEVILADKEPAVAKKYGVEAAPTLIVERAGEVVSVVPNLSNIRKFIEENK